MNSILLNGEIANFIKPFLKDASNVEYRIPNIQFKDLLPEKIEAFKTAYTNRLYNSLRHDSQIINDQNLIRIFNRTLADLKPEKIEEYENGLNIYLKQVVQKRLNAFENDQVEFVNLTAINVPLPANSFSYNSQDFINPPADEESDPNNEKNTETEQRLAKYQKKYLTRSAQKQQDLINRYQSFLNKLTIVQAQCIQIKLFSKLSEVLGKRFEEIKIEDIAQIQKEWESIKRNYEKRQAASADLAYQQLLNEESKNEKEVSKSKTPKGCAKPQVIEKKNQKKAASQVKETKQSSFSLPSYKPSTLEIEVQNLIKNPSFYYLHSRILRWGRNLEEVKNFKDYDSKNNLIVEQYKNLTLKELQQAKESHNLVGIEKILSSEKLKQRYSFPYEYEDKNTHEIKHGIGLFAEKHSRLGKESGVVYIGIADNNLIYHAQFIPLKERFLHPEQIARNFDAIGKSIEEEKWTLTNTYRFSVVDGDVIQMEKGTNPNERVVFLFYPVSIDE